MTFLPEWGNKWRDLDSLVLRTSTTTALWSIKLISVLNPATYVWPHILTMTYQKNKNPSTFLTIYFCGSLSHYFNLCTFLPLSPHFLNCCINCYTTAYGWNILMFLFLFCSIGRLFERSPIPYLENIEVHGYAICLFVFWRGYAPQWERCLTLRIEHPWNVKRKVWVARFNISHLSG